MSHQEDPDWDQEEDNMKCVDCGGPLKSDPAKYYDEFCYECGNNRAPKPEVHSLYRHYKGGEYLVLGIAKHSETKELMVVYASLSYGTVWTRPLKVWNQTIVQNGLTLPRFNRIDRRTK